MRTPVISIDRKPYLCPRCGFPVPDEKIACAICLMNEKPRHKLKARQERPLQPALFADGIPPTEYPQ
jgi:hypothetical protein